MAAKPVTPGNGVNVSPFITPTRPPLVVSLVPIAILPVELTQYREMAQRMRLVQRGHFPAGCLRGNHSHM